MDIQFVFFFCLCSTDLPLVGEEKKWKDGSLAVRVQQMLTIVACQAQASSSSLTIYFLCFFSLIFSVLVTPFSTSTFSTAHIHTIHFHIPSPQNDLAWLDVNAEDKSAGFRATLPSVVFGRQGRRCICTDRPTTTTACAPVELHAPRRQRTQRWHTLYNKKSRLGYFITKSKSPTTTTATTIIAASAAATLLERGPSRPEELGCTEELFFFHSYLFPSYIIHPSPSTLSFSLLLLLLLSIVQ
ncbi:hypothetical protein T02_14576 [Trichinella nativa]|uniref:Uncharacterized protein n=1 Tax=Trichinella nativa TaxID=6335 RepID=A0A0V1KYR4_9BILA|nr:hypothetical protein T02_14576 [Trichinella nativa]